MRGIFGEYQENTRRIIREMLGVYIYILREHQGITKGEY